MLVVLVIVIILVQHVNFQVYSKTLAILKDLIACLSVSFISLFKPPILIENLFGLDGFVL